MSSLSLSLAVGDHDHLRDLFNGTVKAEGVDLTCMAFGVEEILYRAFKYQEFDICDFSMAKYVSMASRGDRKFVAIPVFTSRVFRHSAIFVLRNGPIKTPADLTKAGRIGIPEWAQTAGIYVRGFLMHDHGLRLQDIEWVQAGVSQPGREDKGEVDLPAGVSVRPEKQKSLEGMLLAGEVSAVISAHPLTGVESGESPFVRLFPNYPEVEEQYFAKTGIYPIMHVVVVKAELIDRYPWLARNLFNAFQAAKMRSVERSAKEIDSPFPWLQYYARRASAIIGRDPMPYGIEENRKTLEAFIEFSVEQGIASRAVKVDEMFPATMQNAFKT